jgi:hypothetical protein
VEEMVEVREAEMAEEMVEVKAVVSVAAAKEEEKEEEKAADSARTAAEEVVVAKEVEMAALYPNTLC